MGPKKIRLSIWNKRLKIEGLSDIREIKLNNFKKIKKRNNLLLGINSSVDFLRSKYFVYWKYPKNMIWRWNKCAQIRQNQTSIYTKIEKMKLGTLLIFICVSLH